MDSIYSSSVSATPPAAPVVPLIGFPRAGNALAGEKATRPGPYWFHMITQEQRNVVLAAGLTPDFADLTQLAKAVRVLGAGVGGFSGLTLSATGSSASVSISVARAVLISSDGESSLVSNATLAVNTTAIGAGGLDVGPLQASTWYSVWLISNGVSVAGLISLSPSAPVLPAGYVFRTRVGWIRTDGSVSKFPLGFTQKGRVVQYLVSASGNLQAVPIMASGIAGNVNTPVWVSVATGSFVPPTACQIRLALRGANTGSVLCAPNAAYGGPNSTTNPAHSSSTVSATTYGAVHRVDMVLESSNVFWASDVSTNLLACIGWEDNL